MRAFASTIPCASRSRSGQGIDAGQVVFASIAAANRDPAVFEDPNRLDVTRHPNPHLAFSRGIHFCLGVPLARLEGAIAFRALLQRFGRGGAPIVAARRPVTSLPAVTRLLAFVQGAAALR